MLEHEVPNGSKLYFAKSAKLKRDIENIASDILSKNGFSEILTPIFSYHQHSSIADTKELIKVSDESNSHVTLRADSTLDVVRIIQKRLGRNSEQKKWFYIQPVYSYPTTEQYQIGSEHIGESELSGMLEIMIDIFAKLELEPLMQISNIKIPQIINSMYSSLTLDDFVHVNIEKFLKQDEPWLKKLVYMQSIEQLDEALEIVPEAIKKELLKMRELALSIGYKNLVLAPLYYTDMLYYDELYFRVIDKNETLASGGRYSNDGVDSVGFAIYTDTLIELKNIQG
ncbi:MAG: ATP phosphoribosyltransferase regulatory subunit [Sulfurimonas sp.]|jgi:histidyl-tRNA synthetase|nr:ATP phosphoribosyltransferase regulatory subunit [Sulfurimonadaceae bacterium]